MVEIKIGWNIIFQIVAIIAFLIFLMASLCHEYYYLGLFFFFVFVFSTIETLKTYIIFKDINSKIKLLARMTGEERKDLKLTTKSEDSIELPRKRRKNES